MRPFQCRHWRKPIADTRLYYFINWLERFARRYVREVDYAPAPDFPIPIFLAFGTHRDVIPGLAAWQATQWDNVWPKTLSGPRHR